MSAPSASVAAHHASGVARRGARAPRPKQRRGVLRACDKSAARRTCERDGRAEARRASPPEEPVLAPASSAHRRGVPRRTVRFARAAPRRWTAARNSMMGRCDRVRRASSPRPRVRTAPSPRRPAAASPLHFARWRIAARRRVHGRRTVPRTAPWPGALHARSRAAKRRSAARVPPTPTPTPRRRPCSARATRRRGRRRRRPYAGPS